MFKAFEDLKPENVFLSATGYVKLVEFSLAKVVNGRTGATELPTPQLATQKRWKFFVWAETPWTFLVKLLFFGGEIASEWKEEVTLSTSSGEQHLRTYTIVGTPEYLAPEMIGVSGHNQVSLGWYEVFVD